MSEILESKRFNSERVTPIFRQNEIVSKGILSTIGNTPLIKLERLSYGKELTAYAKIECFNPGGSIKDRTSKAILEAALQSGEVGAGDTIIESSSGNMAIGLAQMCLYHRLRLIVVTDPTLNKHTEKILEAYGAIIEKVHRPKKEGGYLASRIERVKELLKLHKNSFWTNQYSNLHNPLAHLQTMKEIYQALDEIDYLFVATSTCGTLMGCAEYIKTNGLKTRIIAVDALGSKIFSSYNCNRLIPGHGAGTESKLLQPKVVYRTMLMRDLDCVKGCWDLLHTEAIMAGGSSGAVVSAFNRFSATHHTKSKAVLLLADRGERYLDTIYNKRWINTHFPNLEFS